MNVEATGAFACHSHSCPAFEVVIINYPRASAMIPILFARLSLLSFPAPRRSLNEAKEVLKVQNAKATEPGFKLSVRWAVELGHASPPSGSRDAPRLHWLMGLISVLLVSGGRRRHD